MTWSKRWAVTPGCPSRRCRGSARPSTTTSPSSANAGWTTSRSPTSGWTPPTSTSASTARSCPRPWSSPPACGPTDTAKSLAWTSATARTRRSGLSSSATSATVAWTGSSSSSAMPTPACVPPSAGSCKAAPGSARLSIMIATGRESCLLPGRGERLGSVTFEVPTAERAPPHRGGLDDQPVRAVRTSTETSVRHPDHHGIGVAPATKGA